MDHTTQNVIIGQDAKGLIDFFFYYCHAVQHNCQGGSKCRKIQRSHGRWRLNMTTLLHENAFRITGGIPQ